jgi:hypothetical protein
VGFEPTIPVFERAKTILALDSAATVIGSLVCLLFLNVKGNVFIYNIVASCCTLQFITNLISTVLCATIPQPKSLKLFKTSGQKIKMAGTCSACERHARYTKVLLENLEEREYLGEIGVDWIII